MSTTSMHKTVTVAVVGNPNTGKSTLFSALVGLHQRTGNYPGVTVEKKVGHTTIEGRRFQLIDLPGTYSLAPRSPDEMVAVDVLLGRRDDVSAPDVILCVVDASNLERNLYLVSQVLELGRPVVVALNMMDLAADKGMQIDVQALQERLGVPVIPLQAHRRIGLADLRRTLAEVADRAAACAAEFVSGGVSGRSRSRGGRVAGRAGRGSQVLGRAIVAGSGRLRRAADGPRWAAGGCVRGAQSAGAARSGHSGGRSDFAIRLGRADAGWSDSDNSE